VQVHPPLELSVTINNPGTVKAQTGTATISGTVNCSRAISVNLGGTLEQLFARRVTVSGTFSTQVECTAPSTNWTVSVTGNNGRFGAGSASATVNAFGCELTCHSAPAAADIHLVGRR
jgi:hypothetical protein